jgi:hypothetical protein
VSPVAKARLVVVAPWAIGALAAAFAQFSTLLATFTGFAAAVGVLLHPFINLLVTEMSLGIYLIST